MVVPIIVPDSLTAKIVVAVITIVALIFFIRAYFRNGLLGRSPGCVAGGGKPYSAFLSTNERR